MPLQFRKLEFQVGEGDVATPFSDIQKRYPQVVIGSYPIESATGYATNPILRSRDDAALDAAFSQVKALAQSLTKQDKARGWT